MCVHSKARKVQHRRKTHGDDQETGGDGNDVATNSFGDLVTADHIIVGEKHESRRNDTVAVVIQDKHTMWLGGYPKASKTTADTVAALQHFAGPNDKVKLFYSDGFRSMKAPPRR